MYYKVKDQRMYLYCATNSTNNTVDLSSSKIRYTKTAKRFLKKALAVSCLL
ncbi:DDE-type integrase/transposase/recombinase [Bacillus sp. NPDC077411]|uniref:DDE-type integrase/transposase/recombinase n=1 Tax=Bacillus TaxID=1386 RepID=UPI0037C89D7C